MPQKPKASKSAKPTLAPIPKHRKIRTTPEEERALAEVTAPQDRMPYRVWVRVTAEIKAEIQKVSVHLTNVRGRPMYESDAMRHIVDLGLQALRQKTPHLLGEEGRTAR